MRAGKVIGLRRGMYALADEYRRVPLNPAALANALYAPSYLSGLWALGYYGLIPERVVLHTCVTSRGPKRFENPWGEFIYQHVKQDFFFGSRRLAMDQQPVRLAEPEKALLDHWHLTPGEWTPARLAEMRYQPGTPVSARKLRAYARRFHSPRVQRAVERWLALCAAERRGTVVL